MVEWYHTEQPTSGPEFSPQGACEAVLFSSSLTALQLDPIALALQIEVYLKITPPTTT